MPVIAQLSAFLAPITQYGLEAQQTRYLQLEFFSWQRVGLHDILLQKLFDKIYLTSTKKITGLEWSTLYFRLLSFHFPLPFHFALKAQRGIDKGKKSTRSQNGV